MDGVERLISLQRLPRLGDAARLDGAAIPSHLLSDIVNYVENLALDTGLYCSLVMQSVEAMIRLEKDLIGHNPGRLEST